jgi:parallel beta helix pectate lyase-like protein
MISKTVLRWLTLVALVGLSLGLMFTAASADTEITSCPTTITTAGNFFLKKNLTSTGDCIIVHHSNVAIDMKGHTITGNGTGGGITDTGTFVESVAISSGTIKDFLRGIDFRGLDSDLITLERINALNNQGDGIFIRGCCNSLTQIKANNNGGAGIDNPDCCDVFNQIQANDNLDAGLLETGCCSTATKVTTNDDGDSGTVLTSCCSSASNITANKNKGDGIFMDGCCNGVVNGKANNNTDAGIAIDNDDNQVTNSTANNNGGDGLEFGSDTNEVADSTANGNKVDGIDLGNGDFNTVTHVTANNNDADGVVLLCNLFDEGNAVRVSAHGNHGHNLDETGTGLCTNLLNNAP